jgi:hypothetical protein
MDHQRSPPPSIRHLARRLLSGGGPADSEPAGSTSSCERLCQGLQAELGPLITSSAFQALCWRAVYLASREFPVLKRITARDVGSCSLEALRAPLPEHEQRQLPEGLVALVAHLIWILLLLLGEHLIVRALGSVRPDVHISRGRSLLEGSLDA